MKKKNLQKIQLHKETLHSLDRIPQVAGMNEPSGNPMFKTCASGDTDCHWTCPYSACNPGGCTSAAPSYCLTCTQAC